MNIEKRYKDLCSELSIDTTEKVSLEKAEMHRIVMHYVYEKCLQHQTKYDNYVALYGFLRSIAMVFCIFSNFLIVTFFIKNFDCFRSNWNGAIAFYTPPVIFVVILAMYAWISVNRTEKKEKSLGLTIEIKWMNNILFGISLIVIFLSTIFVYVLMDAGIKSFIPDLIQIASFVFASYISYLGFAKFYRRFTLENFMSLLTYSKSNKE